jgi:hypothetical protein
MPAAAAGPPRVTTSMRTPAAARTAWMPIPAYSPALPRLRTVSAEGESTAV